VGDVVGRFQRWAGCLDESPSECRMLLYAPFTAKSSYVLTPMSRRGILTMASWKTAYYGSNLSRPIDVKRQVDPDDLFRFRQSVPV
jgi:Berberine and berberine like